MRFLEDFLTWASACLDGDDGARSYLLGRGVSSDQVLRHRLGYVGGEFFPDISLDPGHNSDCGDIDRKPLWCDSCRFLRWSTKWEASEDGGPKVAFPGRRISDSVVFPLTSYSGSVVGLQIRSIVEKDYDTFLVKRRPEGYFFGTSCSVGPIWSRKEAWVVEGPHDHLLLERLVAPNVLALTTSSPGKDQGRFLRRFCDRVNLCLDADSAGRKGVVSFFEHNSLRMGLRDVRYPCRKPKEKDLGDYWRRVGDEAFRQYFQEKIRSEF